MKGVNEIYFNIATIEEIVQHYFDTVLFKDGASPKVASVSLSARGSQDMLTVRATPKDAAK